MKVAWFSKYGGALSWALRLQDEGDEVLGWIKAPTHKSIGRGLIPTIGSADELCAWAKSNAAAGAPVLCFFDCSGMGEIADSLRKWGLNVIGGGTFCDKTEHDRAFGADLARENGIALPRYKEFGSLSEALAFARNVGDEEVYFKPDREDMGSDGTYGAKDGERLRLRLKWAISKYGKHGKAIFQEKIDGAPISTNRWWNGKTWVGPYLGDIEHKKYADGERGPSTGCAFNAVWYYEQDEPEIARLLNWPGLELIFRRHEAPPGLYDVNAILADGKAYFLEWTNRIGYDCETTAFRLMPDLGAYLWAVATGETTPEPSRQLAYSTRLSIPPYPSEDVPKDCRSSCDGRPLPGITSLWDGHFIAGEVRLDDELGLVCAATDGLVGLSIAIGDDLSDLNDEVVEYAKGLHIDSLYYRSDGAEHIAEDVQKIADEGVADLHPGLET